MEKTRCTGNKSSDGVKLTSWMDMTVSQIDEYLNYDFDSSLKTNISVVQHQQRRRCRLTIPLVRKSSDSRALEYCLNNKRKALVQPIEHHDILHAERLQPNIESLSKLVRKSNNPRTLCSDINVKAGLLFGCDTVSPYVGYLAGKIENDFQIPKHLFDQQANRLIDAVYSDLETLYYLYAQGKNIFTFPMRKLRYLHTRLNSFKDKGFMHFLTFLVHMMQNLSNQNAMNVPSLLCQLIQRIELAFGTKDLGLLLNESCPALIDGHFFLAPPGTGKTQFLIATQLGMLDTDWFSSKLIDENVQILDNLLTLGFSIVSNRWEYDQLKHPVVCIQSNDINRGLFMKTNRVKKELDKFEADKKNFLQSKYQEAYNRCSLYSKRNPDEWVQAYSKIENVCAVVVLDHNQSFIHGFSKVLDYYIHEIVANSI